MRYVEIAHPNHCSFWLKDSTQLTGWAPDVGLNGYIARHILPVIPKKTNLVSGVPVCTALNLLRALPDGHHWGTPDGTHWHSYAGLVCVSTNSDTPSLLDCMWIGRSGVHKYEYGIAKILSCGPITQHTHPFRVVDTNSLPLPATVADALSAWRIRIADSWLYAGKSLYGEHEQHLLNAA